MKGAALEDGRSFWRKLTKVEEEDQEGRMAKTIFGKLVAHSTEAKERS